MTFAQELQHVCPTVEVQPLDAGFPALYGFCQAKRLFDRMIWGEMHLEGATPEAQLRDFLTRMCPDSAQAAIWLPGSYARVLYRLHPRVCWSRLSVGAGMTAENRAQTYRALWDVGIRELHHHAHPHNPHTQTMQAMGHFEYMPSEDGRYLHGIRRLTERP